MSERGIEGGSAQGIREWDVKGCGAIGAAARGAQIRESIRPSYELSIN
jgi:hypothetical protein